MARRTNVCMFMLFLAAIEVCFWIQPCSSESIQAQAKARVGNLGAHDITDTSTDMAEPVVEKPCDCDCASATPKQTEKEPKPSMQQCRNIMRGEANGESIKSHESSQEKLDEASRGSADQSNTSGWSLMWILAALGLVAAAGPGIKITVDFMGKLNKAKDGKRYDSIDNYDALHEKDSAGEREESYASLVNAYYDLATEFYEWGWGTSFHFADKRKGESFRSSILRHETYLAGRLNVNKEAKLLDCGCGVGGPARNIAAFTGAHVTGITINNFQVQRGNTLSEQQGCSDQTKFVQGDFMKLPFPDNSFDGVYAIEATCHAPDRNGVYSEILRVLKPGGIFATYEWCLTDSYDKANAEHRKIKKDIEVGDGLPDMCHTSVCTKALQTSGFDLIEARDCAFDGHEGGEPWYRPLTPSYKPWAWPRFQFNPVMFKLMPKVLGALEFVKVVPAGTAKTQVMLQAGGVGCERGGATGCFTPMWLMVGRKPEKK